MTASSRAAGSAAGDASTAGESVSDPLTILLTHNRWATRRVLEACAALSREQFHQPFEIGLGSLHDTMRHIVGAMLAWNDVLAERESRPRLEEQGDRTAAELIALLDDAAAELESLARAHPLEEQVTRERGGRSYTFTRGAVLAHVPTHGMHHRAQCVNMLRHLGVEDPNPSVLTWMLTAGATRGGA